jgi:hypothetical protein
VDRCYGERMEFGHLLVDTHAYIPAANAMADLKRCRGEAEPMAGAPGSGMAAHGHGEWEAIRRNAHHFDQAIRLRQIMGAWPPPSGSWTW